MVTKYYLQKDNEEIAEAMIKAIQDMTKKEIFTVRFLDTPMDEERLEAVFAFTDKTMLKAEMFLEEENNTDKMAVRCRGNYL